MLGSASAELLAPLVDRYGRVLLFGQSGVGKSTLAAALARAVTGQGRRCSCLGADPGSPAFGVPGAVCMADWRGGAWRLTALEGLCTLDGGRFRLPLVTAVRRLAASSLSGPLLVDAPGVVRGIAGAELLGGLVQAAAVAAVLVVIRDASVPLADELASLPVPVFAARASAESSRPGKRIRARCRTGLWDAYLDGAPEQLLSVRALRFAGAPPSWEAAAAWVGRQAAILAGGGHTLALGEVVALDAVSLRIRAPTFQGAPITVLVRDARRTAQGMLETEVPFVGERLHYLAPPELGVVEPPAAAGGPRLTGRVGQVTFALVNGVFGDPLLHLRLRHQRRSLLFDLGEGARLPARIVHQITDVFISHAHMDHIAGFLGLLRGRIGELAVCRLYGPPGLAQHIQGMVDGILWDRVGARGPRFEVTEFHHGRLRRCRLQVGWRGCQDWSEIPAPNGVLLEDAGFRVRALTLDHGTPVLAFMFEPTQELNVRKDRLVVRDLAPGAWLGELKQRVQAGDRSGPVTLPDGSVQPAGRLADDLLRITPGKRLVYATDLGDTEENRRQLTAFAAGAHTLFCEASFRVADMDQARRTGHLTTRACGEIGSAARVARLVPFHFSRRYLADPAAAYEEVAARCPRTAVPDAAALLGQESAAGSD